MTVTLSLSENLSTIFGDKLNGLVGTMIFRSDSGLIKGGESHDRIIKNGKLLNYINGKEEGNSCSASDRKEQVYIYYFCSITFIIFVL